MQKRIELSVLRPTPCLKLDGEPISFKPQSAYDFFVYLAVENRTEYEREALRIRLYGAGGNPNYLRTGVLPNIPETVKALCFPECEKGVLVYDPTHVWVDALEFEQRFEQTRRLSPGMSDYETSLTDAYNCYTGDFLSAYPVTWTDWIQPKQQRLRQQFVGLAEALTRHHLLYGQYRQAITCAEKWNDHCPDSDIALQYLIWLSLTLHQNTTAVYYLEKLADCNAPHSFIGLSAEEWHHHIQAKKDMTLDLLRLQPPDIQPTILMELPPPVDLHILNDGKDIPGLVSAAAQNIKSGHLQHASQQLQLAHELSAQNDHWLSEIYHQQGILQNKLGHYASAIALYKQALQVQNCAPYLDNHSAILANLGVSEYFQGHYRRAIDYLDASYWAATHEVKDETVRGYAKSTLAMVLSQMGDHRQAFVHYQHALAIFQQIGHEEQMAYTLFNLAQLRYADHELNDAVEYLGRGTKLANALRYPELLTLSLWYQGALKLAMEDFVKAEKSLRTGMEIALDARLLWLEGAGHTELGKVYLCRGDSHRALKTFERILGFALEKGSSEYVAKALYGMGLTILEDAYPAGRNDLNFSIHHLRQSLPSEVLKSAPPVKSEHFVIAEKLFKRGMPNFSDIRRYRVNDALQHLLGLTG